MSNSGEDLNRLELGPSKGQTAGNPSKHASGVENEPSQDLLAEISLGASSKTPTPNKAAANTQAAANSKSTANPTQTKPNPQEVAPNALDANHSEPPTKGGFWKAAPSWMISTVVHVAAIIGLAAWNFEPITKELSLMLNVGDPVGNDKDSDALEEFAMEDSSSDIQSDNTEVSESLASIEPSSVEAKVDINMSNLVAAAAPELGISGLGEALAPSSGIGAQSNAALRAGLNSRSKESKRELLRKYGGTSDTERAVTLALKWLAEHQNRETGAWTLSHSLVCGGKCDRPGERARSVNAATGLALMCFLGAGQTHMEGEFKDTVFKGLSFLIQSMKVQGPYGAWWVGNGGEGLDDMYAHGIASIAMCEAYGMTRDPRLQEAAQLSINYLTFAQNTQTGGWHYAPYPEQKMPGDTSVVGWQMMAIKSAAMSGLNYDIDTIRRANFFLDSMMVPGGFGYHYSMDSKQKSPSAFLPAMTACGVLCRMYSGWNKEDPTIKSAVAKFVEMGPNMGDAYYTYYATQVLKQYGGAEWESWNGKMRDLLVSSQSQSGHSAGSWYFDDAHGSTQGGRLYITCMATMMLEVYYRYMPLYAEQAEEDAFQL